MIAIPIVLVTLLVVLLADDFINWNARRVVAKECV